MAKINSDIIEIRLYDYSYQLFFKGRARVTNEKELKELITNLKDKGLKIENLILQNDWF